MNGARSKATIFGDMAPSRSTIHKNHNGTLPDELMPLSQEHYDRVGMAGEMLFGETFGIFPNTKLQAGGDGGSDFNLPLMFTVDVKTSEHAGHLIHAAHKSFADVFMLAKYHDGAAHWVGWEWGSLLKQAPIREFGKGVRSHCIPAKDLKPVSELLARQARLISTATGHKR